MGVVIELPWQSSKLSPNYNGHWAPKNRAIKAARTGAAWAVKEQARGIDFTSMALPLPVTITSFPPDRRRYDDDNLNGRCKHAIDGVADAIGVDDSKWRMTFRRGEVVKGGRVTIEINGATE